jgi:hypothetical protein
VREKHSRPVSGGRGYWWTDTLWAASADLPVTHVGVSSLPELEQDCWFGGRAPTIRQVAEHSRRIQDANFSHPVILASDGTLMDGGHRLAKAWLDGRATVAAVRFKVDPPPDWIEPTEK